MGLVILSEERVMFSEVGGFLTVVGILTAFIFFLVSTCADDYRQGCLNISFGGILVAAIGLALVFFGCFALSEACSG